MCKPHVSSLDTSVGGPTARCIDRCIARALARSVDKKCGMKDTPGTCPPPAVRPPARLPPPHTKSSPRAGQAASYRGETHQASGPCSTKAGMPPACWTGSPPGFGKKVVQLTRNVGSSAPRSVARLLSRSAVVSTAVSLARWRDWFMKCVMRAMPGCFSGLPQPGPARPASGRLTFDNRALCEPAEGAAEGRVRPQRREWGISRRRVIRAVARR